MKIKSLLLGSAAAIAAAGGAVAADLPAAAPADYVMICGDFSQAYVIPGTDVCLDIGGMVGFEVDVKKIDDEDAVVDYSTDADIHITASTATEYGALIAHIELESDDIVDDGTMPSFDDTYIQFGGDLFIKAGYYDGVGDAGDDISTVDHTEQGDTIGFGYGMESISFAADVMLDSDDDTDDAVEGIGAVASFTGIDNLTLGVFGNAALQGDTSYAAGANVSYSLDALTVDLRGYYEDSGNFDSITGWVTVTYAVTESLEAYIDAEFSTAGETTDDTAFHIDGGVDYTVAPVLVIGANVGFSQIDDVDTIFGGADITRSF